MTVIQNEYTGNGSQTLYSFTFEYIDQADVTVSINNSITTDWTFANPTTVQFNTAPANGASIKIKRNTTVDDPKAVFYPGSTIRAQDLNDNFEQILYVVQEADFNTDQSATDSALALTAANAANTKSDSAVSTANTALTAANNAQTAASQAATDAATAQSAATSASADAATAVAAASSVADLGSAFTAEYQTPGDNQTPVVGVVGDVPIKADAGVRLPFAGVSTYEANGSIRFNDALDKIELYDGTQWKTAAGGAEVNTSPPSPATQGDVWYDPDKGRAYVYYTDSDSSQWVEMNPSWDGAVADGAITPAKLSTGGPYWDTSQRVGIGTASPITTLHVDGSGNQNIRVSSTTHSNFIQAGCGSGSTYHEYKSVYRLVDTDNGERARIDSSGRLGIGTASFDGNWSPRLQVSGTASDGSQGILIENYKPAITFKDLSGGSPERKHIWADNNSLFFGTGDAAQNAQATIDSSGRLGIGTTSVGAKLHVQSGSVSGSPRGGSYTKTLFESSDAAVSYWEFQAASTASNDILFSKGNTGSYGIVGYDHSTDALRFNTNSAERMRITSSGEINTYSTTSGMYVSVSAAAGTTTRIYSGQHSSGGTQSGTESFRVWSNGDVQNTNNSYGAISDQTLKENIVPANSQWQDLKDIEVVNYNFKAETGNETFTQLGVIAQQVEAVSPGLVKTDADGLKSVNYSILYMKSVKALQEAITRIETLEAQNAALDARLTALEGGTI